MNIFMTGASGRLAHFAIDYVKDFAPEANLYGLARTEEQAQALEARGVTARIGDYEDKENLVKAFDGMDRLLFISFPNAALSANVVAAAKEAGVGYIAYTSINGIEHAKNGLEINHHQTEQLIRETGIPHTFLRNSWYLEMEMGPFNAALETGNYYYLSDKKVSYATRWEYAEAAARVIVSADFPEVVELGRKASNHIEIAHALQEATRKTFNIKEVDFATYVANLKPYSESGFEAYMQEYVKAGNNGEDQVTPSDFEATLGHKLQSLTSAIKEVLEMDASEFRRGNDKDFKGYK